MTVKEIKMWVDACMTDYASNDETNQEDILKARDIVLEMLSCKGLHFTIESDNADEKYISILKEIREKIFDSYKNKGEKDLTLIELMDILDEYLPEKETMKWQMQNCCCVWKKEEKI